MLYELTDSEYDENSRIMAKLDVVTRNLDYLLKMQIDAQESRRKWWDNLVASHSNLLGKNIVVKGRKIILKDK